MAASPTVAETLLVLSQLSSEQLHARLIEMYAEEKQIRVLLRAARAREKAQRALSRPAQKEATHAQPA